MRRPALVVQWWRLRLLKAGEWVQSLVQEDPARHRTKPMCHNHWAWTPELVLCNKRSHCNENPEHCNKDQPRSPQVEKVHAQQRRPSTAKNKLIKKKHTHWWAILSLEMELLNLLPEQYTLCFFIGLTEVRGKTAKDVLLVCTRTFQLVHCSICYIYFTAYIMYILDKWVPIL